MEPRPEQLAFAPGAVHRTYGQMGVASMTKVLQDYFTVFCGGFYLFFPAMAL